MTLRGVQGVVDAWNRIGVVPCCSIEFQIIDTETEGSIFVFHKDNYC